MMQQRKPEHCSSHVHVHVHVHADSDQSYSQLQSHLQSRRHNNNNNNNNRKDRGKRDRFVDVLSYSKVLCALQAVVVLCGFVLAGLAVLGLSHTPATHDNRNSSNSNNNSNSNNYEDRSRGFPSPRQQPSQFYDRSNAIRAEPPATSLNGRIEDNRELLHLSGTISRKKNKNQHKSSAEYHTGKNKPSRNRTSSSMTWDELDAGSLFSVRRNMLGPPKIVPEHLPLPIFVLNLPKSGTTTIHRYFQCGMGNLFAVHHSYPAQHMPLEVPANLHMVATCMGHNWISDRPLVEGCGGFAVYTDAGGIVQDRIGDERVVPDSYEYDKGTTHNTTEAASEKAVRRRSFCFYPGVHALENIAKHYPHATILHLPRNATDWVRSSERWSEANGNTNRNNTASGGRSKRSLLHRYDSKCDAFVPNATLAQVQAQAQAQPQNRKASRSRSRPRSRSLEEWARWYREDYTVRIRRFAADHPTLTYLESPLEDPETPLRLESATGISAAACFGHHLKSSLRSEHVQRRKHDGRGQRRRQGMRIRPKPQTRPRTDLRSEDGLLIDSQSFFVANQGRGGSATARKPSRTEPSGVESSQLNPIQVEVPGSALHRITGQDPSIREPRQVAPANVTAASASASATATALHTRAPIRTRTSRRVSWTKRRREIGNELGRETATPHRPTKTRSVVGPFANNAE